MILYMYLRSTIRDRIASMVHIFRDMVQPCSTQQLNPTFQQFLLGWTQHPPRFAEDFVVTSTRDSEWTGESSLKTDQTDGEKL